MRRRSQTITADFAATKTGNAGNFWSMRQTPRSCGHISVTEHFKAWAAQGLKLGKMYEAKVLVEAGGGVGRIDSRPPTSCGNEAR